MKFEVIQHEQTPNTPLIDDINLFIEENKDCFEAFKEYAMSQKTAVGLAANQCSVDGERFSLRMVAVKNVLTNEWIIAIDPKITKYYGVLRQKPEGCLTWGFDNKYYVIIANRNHFVDVEYYTPDGIFHKETHKGFNAQVWQHELNHINGIKEVVVHGYVTLELPIDFKTERNAPCPCGSGLKYKKCCIES
jgi:peptide deformylase